MRNLKKFATLFIIVFLMFKFTSITSYINIYWKLIQIRSELSTTCSNFDYNPISNITYKDITYKNRGNLNLKLDIYPAKDNNTSSPVLLYVFGNGWTKGDKSLPSSIYPIINLLNEEGYSIVSTSYELLNDKLSFYNQISDIKDTLRWIHKNADMYNFNSDNIGVIAPSAGAHLTMMAAFTKDSMFKGSNDLYNYTSSVKYIIDLFGPSDLTKINLSLAPKNLINNLSKIDMEILSYKYSPINYLHTNLPNTLIIHSKTDNVVDFYSSVELFQDALKLGNNFEFYTLNNCNHYMDNISDKEAFFLYAKIIDFILSQSK